MKLKVFVTNPTPDNERHRGKWGWLYGKENIAEFNEYEDGSERLVYVRIEDSEVDSFYCNELSRESVEERRNLEPEKVEQIPDKNPDEATLSAEENNEQEGAVKPSETASPEELPSVKSDLFERLDMYQESLMQKINVNDFETWCLGATTSYIMEASDLLIMARYAIRGEPLRWEDKNQSNSFKDMSLRIFSEAQSGAAELMKKSNLCYQMNSLYTKSDNFIKVNEKVIYSIIVDWLSQELNNTVFVIKSSDKRYVIEKAAHHAYWMLVEYYG